MSADDIRVDVEKFVIMLQVAQQSRMSYGESHKLAQAAIAQAHRALQTAMRDRTDITIGVIGAQFAFDTQPLFRLAKAAQSLMSCLAEAKVDKITFRPPTGQDELAMLLSVLAARQKDGETANTEMAKLRNISLGGASVEDDPEKAEKAEKAEESHAAAMKTAAADFSEGVGLLDGIARSLGQGPTLDVTAASTFVGKILGRLLDNRYPFLITASLRRHDEYSFVHSMNVAVLSLSQAQGLGFTGALLADIGMAGFLHDAGKLEVAGELLRKKERLTDEEYEQVKLHPLNGAKILVQIADINPLVAAAAFEHHLRMDGTGYPRKMVGGGLNLASMIVAIADIYDAMRSKRSYRDEMKPEAVHAEMLKMAGTSLQPDLLHWFFRTLGVFPPGTLVELDNGYVGMVMKEHPTEIRRPTVELWYARDRVKLRRARLVDLSERQPGGGFMRSIVKSVSLDDGYELPEKYRTS